MTVQNPTPVLVTSVLTVPFHGDRLLLVEHQGEPYVPLRPITKALGLSWARQYRKLKEDPERWPVVALRATAEDGKNYEMVCLHLRKIPTWLYSISLKRIPDERVREKVRRYQLECDEVLWRYWFERRLPASTPTGDLQALDERLRAFLDQLEARMDERLQPVREKLEKHDHLSLVACWDGKRGLRRSWRR